MKIIYSPDHIFHNPATELHRGEVITPNEGPYRIDLIQKGLKAAGFRDFVEPGTHDMSLLSTLHSPEYLEFLETAWQRWQEAGYGGNVVGVSCRRGPHASAPPADIDGAAGYFAAASDTAITETTWQAAQAGVHCALAAADALGDGGQGAFSLSRPPGHHAGVDYMHGYCFLNTAGAAAQSLLNKGAAKVAILDVDFHHGNGTQDIFYDRGDVFFASLHGAPDHHFPYFWGHRDEIGAGPGAGYTANYPLAAGTDFTTWHAALQDALGRIAAFGADALVVSLGVDIYENDPLSSFKIATEDFRTYGGSIGAAGLPTAFIMEGGYGVPEVGVNVCAVLDGFLNA